MQNQMNTELLSQPGNTEFVGIPGCSREPDGNQSFVSDVPQKQASTRMSTVFWILQPLFPYYIAMKLSNAKISYLLSILENVVFQMKNLFLSVETEKDESLLEDDLTLTESVIESLYRIWFVAHTNVRESVDYIEAVYEEIVPLVPDEDPPFADLDKESMTIREMCLHVTEHMCGRLCYHVKQFFQDLLEMH